MATKEEIKLVYEALKQRFINPEGEFDNGGRWYPSEAENCGCTLLIRSPSRKWPYAYMTHCRTLKHVKLVAEQSPELFAKHLASAQKFEKRLEIGIDGTKNSQRYDPETGKIVANY